MEKAKSEVGSCKIPPNKKGESGQKEIRKIVSCKNRISNFLWGEEEMKKLAKEVLHLISGEETAA